MQSSTRITAVGFCACACIFGSMVSAQVSQIEVEKSFTSPQVVETDPANSPYPAKRTLTDDARSASGWVLPQAERIARMRASLGGAEEGRVFLDGRWVNVDAGSAIEVNANVAISGQRARFPRTETETAGENSRGIDLAPGFEREMSPPMVKKYQEARIARLDLLSDRREQIQAQLSLRDLNRYQFRRNRSDEPGIPVRKAGANREGS